MEKTRRADLSRPQRGYVSHNVPAASRNTRDTKLSLDRQKLDKRRQAKYVKGPEAYRAVPHHDGLVFPIAIVALMIGFVLLFFFILSIIPWGFGNGCWAQC